MERAALLLEARYSQDQADQALIRTNAIRGQIETLETDYGTMQASLRDLLTRVEMQAQEVCHSFQTRTRIRLTEFSLTDRWA